MLVGGFRKQVGGLVRNRLVAGFAETEKDIKMRMKSVSSTIKITKAMKMVATAKMKAEVDRMENGKNFGVHFVSTMFKNDEYMTKRVGDFEPRRTLLVPITSDRGLCGAVNAAIVRETRDFLNTHDKSKYSLLIIGDKGTAGLTRNFSELVVGSLNELAIPMNFYNASAMANIVGNVANDYDEMIIIYNEFVNTMSQKLKKISLVTKPQFLKRFELMTKYDLSEPDAEFAKQYFYEFYLASNLYHALLHALASEQASRMNAMENATKNAGEILQGLTLKYNKARQARITMELIEIISGANAL